MNTNSFLKSTKNIFSDFHNFLAGKQSHSTMLDIKKLSHKTTTTLLPTIYDCAIIVHVPRVLKHAYHNIKLVKFAIGHVQCTRT